MPYICVNTPTKMSDDQKIALKSCIGENISLLNGKVEARLMVQINDDCDMYFAGNPKDEIAFVEVRLFRVSEFSDKEKFVQAVFGALKDILSVNPAESFISVTEHLEWGSNGSYNK